MAQVTPTEAELLPVSDADGGPNAVLISGARIFTGCSEEILDGQDVFVAGQLISRVGPDLEPPEFATIVEADGRTLIPGLIDAHWHGVFAEATIGQLFTTNEGYPLSPLGVIEEGAYADLILVDGNPLEDRDLIADPEENFELIMKDGVIYKDTVN